MSLSRRFITSCISFVLLINLSGCIVISVAAEATATVVGGVVEVVDVVTPDIIDDDDDEDHSDEDAHPDDDSDN